MRERTGSLLSSYALIWVTIGLALALILLGIASRYSLGTDNNPQTIEGDTGQVSKQLADLAETCWQRQQGEPESTVCQVTDIKTNDSITEGNFTRYLDCKKLENADHNCGQKDEVEWEVNCQQCSVKIQYRPGKLLIKALN